MLVTLDSFNINANDIIDLELLEWYEKNRDKTKQLVKLGYFILKDGLSSYIKAEEGNETKDAFNEAINNMKASFHSMFEEEYKTKNSIAILQTEQKIEKKYLDELRCVRDESLRYKMLLENKRESEEELRIRIENMTRLQCEQETIKFKTLYEELKAKNEVDVEKEKRIDELEREVSILKKTNFAKGNKGEHLILNYLQKRFPLFEYKDCSKEKHSGDIHMIKVDNCGDFIMIESKYKETISKQDVDKFYSDIEHLEKTGRGLTGAIFVSLMTKNIPHIGEMRIEIVKGVPILFIGFNGEEEFEQWFDRYIALICELASYGKKCRLNENNVDDIMRKISPLLDNVKMLKNNIEKMRTVHLMHVNTAAADIEQGIKKLMDSIGELLSREKVSMSETCLICNASFASKRSLTTHMRVHKTKSLD